MGERSRIPCRSTIASLVLAGFLLLSALGCDLIPGHKEAALRKRVDADSFPTAAEALHSPSTGDK